MELRALFPDADVKIFLTASPRERAKRRYIELIKRGYKSSTIEDLEKEIEARDKEDSQRTIAPLKKAQDAIELLTESEWTEYNRDREKRSRGIVIQNDSSSIEIDLDKGDALKLALKAHDQNITLNQHIINVLKHQLENDDFLKSLSPYDELSSFDFIIFFLFYYYI